MRPITLDDVELLLDLNRDPEVMRYLTGGEPTPRSEVEAAVQSALGSRWIASHRETGEFVGWFGLRPHEPQPNEHELGYRLARRWWGTGLATEGSRALIDIAFAERGASRVWAQTMTVNVASRRVMEKCGMRFVRTFHLEWDEPIEGTADGDVEYELRREDWAAFRERA